MMDDEATCCGLFHFSALKLDPHGICGSPAINFDLLYTKAICSIKPSPIRVELATDCRWSSRHRRALFLQLGSLVDVERGLG